MKSLYISRVIIKNYRNFENIDVRLSHKQVINWRKQCWEDEFS